MITVIPPVVQEINAEAAAIESMEICAKEFKVKFELSYSMATNYVVFSSGQWVVKTMGKRFMSSEFVIAVREAIVFVTKAHPGHEWES